LDLQFTALLYAFGAAMMAMTAITQLLQPSTGGAIDPRYGPERALPTALIVGVSAMLLWKSRAAITVGRPRWARPMGLLVLAISLATTLGAAVVGLIVAYSVIGRVATRARRLASST
jgi:hypothetical protein